MKTTIENSRRTIGYCENGGIYNLNWNRIGSYENGRFENADGKWIGNYRNGKVYLVSSGREGNDPLGFYRNGMIFYAKNCGRSIVEGAQAGEYNGPDGGAAAAAALLLLYALL